MCNELQHDYASTVGRGGGPTVLQWDGAPSEVQNRGPAFHARTYLIDRAFRRLRPQTLLDIGCGRGFVTAIAARHARRVIATDMAADAVASTHALLAFHDDAQAVRANALAGDWGSCIDPPATVDAILLAEVLEHLDDDVEVLRACRDLLAVGGHLVLTVPGDPTLWTHWDDLANHRRRYTRAELDAKLESAGFVVERITNWGFPVTGWLAIRGARMRSARVDSHGSECEVPGVIQTLMPLASIPFRILARVEPLFSPLDRGAGYVVVARRG
jgi:SAM-dependent methyltransferase